MPTVMAGGVLREEPAKPAPVEIPSTPPAPPKKRPFLAAILPWKGDGRAKLFLKSILLLLVVLLAAAGCLLGYFYVIGPNRESEIYGRLQNMYRDDVVVGTAPEDAPEGMLAQFYTLYSANEDVRGWLHIEGTSIDYPVMQSPNPRTDPHYYAQHSFDRQLSLSGTPYFSTSAAFYSAQSINRSLTIYGNNTGNSRIPMFSELLNYQDIGFLQEHPLVEMNTIYQNARWKVFAVMLVSAAGEDAFDYTRTAFADEVEFLKYVAEVQAHSLFVIPADDSSAPSDTSSGPGDSSTPEDTTLPAPDTTTSTESKPTETDPPPTETDPPPTEPSETTKPTEPEEPDVPVDPVDPVDPPDTGDLPVGKIDEAEYMSLFTVVDSNGAQRTPKTKEELQLFLAAKVWGEMGGFYSEPEAIKAQAVAAYTCEIYEQTKPKIPSFNPFSNEKHKAVYEAVGEVLGVKIIDTEQQGSSGLTRVACYTTYFSMSCGVTADNDKVNWASLPYLVSVKSPYETAAIKEFETTVTMTLEEMQKKLNAYAGGRGWGTVQYEDGDVPLFALSYSGGEGNYVYQSSAYYVKNGKKTYLTGQHVRLALGLRSPAWEITSFDDTNVTFRVRGYGHGVGMSQYGAYYFAKNDGWTYQQILTHFYSLDDRYQIVAPKW
ncbi:MAG: SpoIID/LytB domain-containing protein [Acutalibacteraceae bacterium]